MPEIPYCVPWLGCSRSTSAVTMWSAATAERNLRSFSRNHRLKDAAKRVEDLRQAAKAHEITYKEQVMDAVTFSVGIAGYPENGLAAEELLHAADSCLYESKANGRDCVTVATTHQS